MEQILKQFEQLCQNKQVLLRLDLNLPIKNKKITDLSRLNNVLPTLSSLIKTNAKTIILSHLGRPENQCQKELSLEPIAKIISQALKVNVKLINCAQKQIAEKITQTRKQMKNGDVVMLENIRFFEGENQNNESFAKNLSVGADIYVNDAFSVSHRRHASVDAITNYLPSYAGPSLNSEIKSLKIIMQTKAPKYALIGGKKINTKIKIIENLTKNFNGIIIAGAMANTFLASQGCNVAASYHQPEFKQYCLQLTEKAKQKSIKLILPSDVVCATNLENPSQIIQCSVNDIPNDYAIFDFGQQSINKIKQEIKKIEYLIWNGPIGVFEFEPFNNASDQVLEAIYEAAQNNQPKLKAIAGGGDTISFIKNYQKQHPKVKNNLYHMSMAGGALLEWLENNELPILKKLQFLPN